MFNYSDCKIQYRRLSRQQGAALIVALVFLLAMTLIGITAMQGTSQQEKMAGNVRDMNISLLAAESAMRVAEQQLFSSNTFTANTGQCLFDNSPDRNSTWLDFWRSDDQWSSCHSISGLTQVSAQPKYAIEDLGMVSVPETSQKQSRPGGRAQARIFRITVRGQGISEDVATVLQSFYWHSGGK